MDKNKIIEKYNIAVKMVDKCKEEYDNSYSYESMYWLYYYRGKRDAIYDIYKEIIESEKDVKFDEGGLDA